MLEEYGSVAAANHHRRTSFFILVESDKLFVLEKVHIELVHLGEVAAYHKRRLEEAPESEVCTVLNIGAAAVRYVALAVHTADEHINVIVAAGAGVSELVNLAHSDILEAAEAVVDIACGAVHMCACGTNPFFNGIGTPVACREEDFASACLERHTHSVVEDRAVRESGFVAEVVLEEVNVPFGKCLRVDEFVVEGTGITGAGACSGAGVHTELKSL